MERQMRPEELRENQDFLVVELEERFEFGVAVIDDSSYDNDVACNGTGCKQNGYCPG